ncbi:MAG TPA: SEC-C metal-binding domain-containing protein [Candidatus Angelobacter sp.]|nr:SEC-C metal-binding domain-containing protein [Candidatus Angelobacter sp.]
MWRAPKSFAKENYHEIPIRRTTSLPAQQQTPPWLSLLRGTSNAAFRAIQGGMKDLREKLGRNDLCPCGSGRRFQEMLHEVETL